MQVLTKFFSLITITAFLSLASAQDDRASMRDAFKTCFHEVGIERGERPSPEQKEKLDACLLKEGVSKEQLTKMKEKRKAFHEGKKACVQELGLKKPENGERLAKEDRQKIRECLKKKGFDKKKDKKRKA